MAKRWSQSKSGEGLQHCYCWLGQHQWTASFEYFLPRSRATSQKLFAWFLREYLEYWWAGPWNAFSSIHHCTHQTVLGKFNAGVQPHGTPISVEVVHEGGVELNVIWRDARGRVVGSSWSKLLGWDLLGRSARSVYIALYNTNISNSEVVWGIVVHVLMVLYITLWQRLVGMVEKRYAIYELRRIVSNISRYD